MIIIACPACQGRKVFATRAGCPGRAYADSIRICTYCGGTGFHGTHEPRKVKPLQSLGMSEIEEDAQRRRDVKIQTQKSPKKTGDG